MTYVAVIPSIQYKNHNSNWRSHISSIVDDVQDFWADEIEGTANEPMNVYGPSIFQRTDEVNLTRSVSPEAVLEEARAKIDGSTNLFDEVSGWAFDSVVVVHDEIFQEDGGYINGIAYNGGYVDGLQDAAAGSDYGVGVTFRTGDSARVVAHEMCHTYGALHQHAGTRGLLGDHRTFMKGRVENCDGDSGMPEPPFGETLFEANQDCTCVAIRGYINEYM